MNYDEIVLFVLDTTFPFLVLDNLFLVPEGNSAEKLLDKAAKTVPGWWSILSRSS